jgi:hypothetical protein
MLLTLFVILFIIWALRMVIMFTIGGFVHFPLVVALLVLLAIALVMLGINTAQGRKI